MTTLHLTLIDGSTPLAHALFSTFPFEISKRSGLPYQHRTTLSPWLMKMLINCQALHKTMEDSQICSNWRQRWIRHHTCVYQKPSNSVQTYAAAREKCENIASVWPVREALPSQRLLVRKSCKIHRAHRISAASPTSAYLWNSSSLMPYTPTHREAWITLMDPPSSSG